MITYLYLFKRSRKQNLTTKPEDHNCLATFRWIIKHAARKFRENSHSRDGLGLPFDAALNFTRPSRTTALLPLFVTVVLRKCKKYGNVKMRTRKGKFYPNYKVPWSHDNVDIHISELSGVLGPFYYPPWLCSVESPPEVKWQHSKEPSLS